MSGLSVADISEQKALETAEECKKFANNPEFRAIAIGLDVTDPTSVQRMIDTAIKDFGRVDYNVNTAGVSATWSFVLGAHLFLDLV